MSALDISYPPRTWLIIERPTIEHARSIVSTKWSFRIFCVDVQMATEKDCTQSIVECLKRTLHNEYSNNCRLIVRDLFPYLFERSTQDRQNMSHFLWWGGCLRGHAVVWLCVTLVRRYLSVRWCVWSCGQVLGTPFQTTLNICTISDLGVTVCH